MATRRLYWRIILALHTMLSLANSDNVTIDGNTTLSTASVTTTTIFPYSTTAITTTAILPASSTDDKKSAQSDVLEYIKEYNKDVTFVDSRDLKDGDLQMKPEIKINKAWLTFNSTVDYEVEIWAQTDECYKCDLMLITKVGDNQVKSILANATHRTDIRLRKINPSGFQEHLCSFNLTFREGGDYWIFVDPPKTGNSCKLILANDPDIAELPILYVFVGLIGLAVAYVVGKKLVIYFLRISAHKRDSMNVTSVSENDGGDTLQMNGVRGDKENNASDASKTDTEKPKKMPRLRSLDTFRGLTLILMAFVNYGAGEYWFLDHAVWNGINVADLVFPWFVFIMGVSMNFSFRSMFRKGWSVPKVTWKIVWRAAKLFLIGFMLGTHFETANLESVRILGVLQRLALTYLVSALIHYCCVRRSDSHQDKKWAVVRDLILYIPEWIINLIILAVHLSLVYALPVPGCPTGYVGPGGLSEGGLYKNCTGGATGYIDSLILGYEHLYQHPTPQVVYQTTHAFDPEGFLATLNSVFLCFLGIQCGRIILIYQNHKQRVIRFLIWAVLLGALGALLTKCSRDDGWIPPNKNIWSLSFSLITASFGYVLLSAIYIITDVLQIWEGQPFIYPGMNSIVIYICHDIFSNTFPVNFEVGEQHWKKLLRCVWGVTCWIFVGYWLYIKKIFIAL